jgi:hypothetical protein
MLLEEWHFEQQWMKKGKRLSDIFNLSQWFKVVRNKCEGC